MDIRQNYDSRCLLLGKSNLRNLTVLEVNLQGKFADESRLSLGKRFPFVPYSIRHVPVFSFFNRRFSADNFRSQTRNVREDRSVIASRLSCSRVISLARF